MDGEETQIPEQERAQEERTPSHQDELRTIVQAVIEEFVKVEQTKSEPAFQAELV
jgi:hypothetical protein